MVCLPAWSWCSDFWLTILRKQTGPSASAFCVLLANDHTRGVTHVSVGAQMEKFIRRRLAVCKWVGLAALLVQVSSVTHCKTSGSAGLVRAGPKLILCPLILIPCAPSLIPCPLSLIPLPSCPVRLTL